MRVCFFLLPTSILSEYRKHVDGCLPHASCSRRGSKGMFFLGWVGQVVWGAFKRGGRAKVGTSVFICTSLNRSTLTPNWLPGPVKTLLWSMTSYSPESQLDVRVTPSDMYSEGDGEPEDQSRSTYSHLHLCSIRNPCTGGPRESGQTRFVI